MDRNKENPRNLAGKKQISASTVSKKAVRCELFRCLQVPWPFGLKCASSKRGFKLNLIQTCVDLWFSYCCGCPLRKMIATRYSQREQPRKDIISRKESAWSPTRRKAQFKTILWALSPSSTSMGSMGHWLTKWVSSLFGSFWPVDSQLKRIVSYQKDPRLSISLQGGSYLWGFGTSLSTALVGTICCAAVVTQNRLDKFILPLWTLCLTASWPSPLLTTPAPATFPGRSGCASPRDTSARRHPPILRATTGGSPAQTAQQLRIKPFFAMILMARGRCASTLGCGVSEFPLGQCRNPKNWLAGQKCPRHYELAPLLHSCHKSHHDCSIFRSRITSINTICVRHPTV